MVKQELANNKFFYASLLCILALSIFLSLETADAISITTDKKIYSWTDTVEIFINAPEYNKYDNVIDYIGISKSENIIIETKKGKLENYKLVETEKNSGIFHGKIILTGDPTRQINLARDANFESWNLLGKYYFTHRAVGVTVGSGHLMANYPHNVKTFFEYLLKIQ